MILLRDINLTFHRLPYVLESMLKILCHSLSQVDTLWTNYIMASRWVLRTFKQCDAACMHHMCHVSVRQRCFAWWPVVKSSHMRTKSWDEIAPCSSGEGIIGSLWSCPSMIVRNQSFLASSLHLRGNNIPQWVPCERKKKKVTLMSMEFQIDA